jgi:hypothetical protein
MTALKTAVEAKRFFGVIIPRPLKVTPLPEAAAITAMVVF